jgi:protease-4
MKTMANKRLLFALIFLAGVCLNNCAFVTIPLFPTTQNLQEQVIEGEGKDKILLLDISGVISEREDSGPLSQQTTSIIEDIKEAMKKAQHDDAIKGIVVKINSPGGTITGSDILHHELKQFKKEKNIRIVACLMDVGTSGGYYVATAADEIMAHPTTITGSIAVIAIKFNVKGLLNLIGVKDETIKSGELKDIWSPFRPSTDKERAIMQAVIDKFHSRFVDVIKEGRKDLSRQEIEKLADGRIFTADEALESRLIDRIGYLDDALDEMKKSLGIPGATVITYSRPGTFKGTIYSKTSSAAPQTLNFISLNRRALIQSLNLRFMYLWFP